MRASLSAAKKAPLASRIHHACWFSVDFWENGSYSGFATSINMGGYSPQVYWPTTEDVTSQIGGRAKDEMFLITPSCQDRDHA